MNTTKYADLSKDELLTELDNVCGTIAFNLREMPALTYDYQHEHNLAYSRSPGNSVSSKVKEADVVCEDFERQLNEVKYEIQALTTIKSLLETLIHARG